MKIKVTSLVLAVALAFAAPAWAAFKTGRYKGSTSQRLPISFTAGKKYATGLTYMVVLDCSDGVQMGIADGGFPRIRIRSQRFRGDFQDNTGAQSVTVSGRLTNRRATGRIHETMKVGADHVPDANGTVTCESQVSFSARKR